MITYRTIPRGLGAMPGAFMPRANFTPQPPGVASAIQAAAASGGDAQTACADPRLTTAAQRAYCAESYQAGLRGDELIVNAMAKSTCADAVNAGLIDPESQTTCVSCARAAIAGAFDASQIPACVAAGGPGAAGPSNKTTLLWVGGGLAALVGLGLIWKMVR